MNIDHISTVAMIGKEVGPIVKWYYTSMAWMELEFNSP
jgi:hypothetical protein